MSDDVEPDYKALSEELFRKLQWLAFHFSFRPAYKDGPLQLTRDELRSVIEMVGKAQEMLKL